MTAVCPAAVARSRPVRATRIASAKGMTRKAEVGGTPGRAPIGYLNQSGMVEGRRVAAVVADPDRAELSRQALELYSTGEYTLEQLTDEMMAM